MRSVTRTMLTTGALVMGVVAVAAQPPQGVRPAVLITEMPVASVPGPARSPQAVIDRVLSFDANADHRVSRDELPERMQGLVARGDRNADAALDSDEIRALMKAGSTPPTRVSFRSQSMEGLRGVVSDLRLPQAKHVRALVLVSGPVVNRVPDSALLGEMKALLDDEEYENFVAAATRLSRNPQIRGGVVGGILKGEFRRPE